MQAVWTSEQRVGGYEVKIFGEMCVLSLIFGYVALCRFHAVDYLIITCFCYILIIRLTFYYIPYIFVSSFLFPICVLCFLCVVSPSENSCLFAIFAQVYRPLPSGGNPTAINKYHTIPFPYTTLTFQSLLVT